MAPSGHVFPKSICYKTRHSQLVCELIYSCFIQSDTFAVCWTVLESVGLKVVGVLLSNLKHAFVYQEKQMMVYVERRVADDASLSKDEAFGSIRNQLCTFREGESPVCLPTCHTVKTLSNAETNLSRGRTSNTRVKNVFYVLLCLQVMMISLTA